MIERILRALDGFLGLRKPEPKNPPPPPTPPSSPDTTGQAEPPNGQTDPLAKLDSLYSELGAEMRALRSTEATVASGFYTVLGLLFAGSGVMLASIAIPSRVKVAGSVGAILLIVIHWFSVHGRIAHDNASYAHLMNRRRWIEERWFWEGMPGRPENIGDGPSGPGYRKTQGVIAKSAISACLLLALLLALATDWYQECPDCQSHKQIEHCGHIPERQVTLTRPSLPSLQPSLSPASPSPTPEPQQQPAPAPSQAP